MNTRIGTIPKAPAILALALAFAVAPSSLAVARAQDAPAPADGGAPPAETAPADAAPAAPAPAPADPTPASATAPSPDVESEPVALALDLADRSYSALGAGARRKVPVEWNRYYDHAGLGEILRRLAEAFPNLARFSSLGTSVEGRDLWMLEVTNFERGDPHRKPAMFIDGNIHGNEVQAAEVVAYTAWYLCHEYERLPRVRELLDRATFYLLPSTNPDGRDRWLHGAQTPHSSRTGVRPTDNDRDGAFDEDDYDDLDGDGSISLMRIRDPEGRHRPHPDFPEFLMTRAPDDEKGEYTILGYEGIDDDGDGLVNEDGAGGYDGNRNWAYDWQPNYVQYGAQDYPFSLPETRAIADFVLARPNIAGMQSYHNYGGMILRPPGREGGVFSESDDAVLRRIAERGEAMLPFYNSMVIWKDLYTVWGGEVDWFYGGRGVLTFTNELWSQSNLLRRDGEPTDEQKGRFLEDVLMGDGIVPWKPFDHPLYGPIEIGGTRKEWSRTPPSFLLEEECHRNMAFTLLHADSMPRLSIRAEKVEPLGGGLHRVVVAIENDRPIPTRTEQDVDNHISPPDVVTASGEGLRVVTAGRVADRHAGRVEPVERRPERVELETIAGMSVARVQFVVAAKDVGPGGSEGARKLTVTVDSAKGGVFAVEVELKAGEEVAAVGAGR